MRKFSFAPAALILLLLWLPGSGRADVNFGLSIGDDGVKGFYLAVGDHYGVPEKEMVVIRQAKVSDEELPVIFFLARRTGAAPEAIIKLRLGGKSWMDISLRLGLDAEAYYVPVKHNPGPPYGHAYGHFNKKAKKQWREIRLNDADIVNFVNLRFVSDYYGYSPDEIIKMRENGKSFVAINAEVKKNKAKARAKAQASADKKEKKEKGNKK